MKHFLPILGSAALMFAVPAHAADDNAQLWFNPTVQFDIDSDSTVRLETQQRFRSASVGADSFAHRLWLDHKIDQNVTVSAAVNYTVSSDGNDEVRLLQQVSLRSGIVRARVRLEQRFFDRADRTGWRLRPRVGVSVPVDDARRLSAVANAEFFFTLQSQSLSGLEGFTGLRTQLGFDYRVNDRLSIGLSYVRQQDVRRGRADLVGHAPQLAMTLRL